MKFDRGVTIVFAESGGEFLEDEVGSLGFSAAWSFAGQLGSCERFQFELGDAGKVGSGFDGVGRGVGNVAAEEDGSVFENIVLFSAGGSESGDLEDFPVTLLRGAFGVVAFPGEIGFFLGLERGVAVLLEQGDLVIAIFRLLLLPGGEGQIEVGADEIV